LAPRIKNGIEETMTTTEKLVDTNTLTPTSEQIERERVTQMETLRVFRRGLLTGGHSPRVELFPLAGKMPVLR
jgi:hypothetical protein